MRALTALTATTGLILALAAPATASAQACVDPSGVTWAWCSSDTEGTWNTGAYKVQNDNWGPGGPQTIYADSPSHVEVVTDQNFGTQIVTYPDVGALYTGADLPVSDFSVIQSHYTENFPADTTGEAANDVWLNNWSIEIMIWVDTHNEDPTYLPQIGTANLNGQQFEVLSNAPEYIFYRPGQQTSGVTHILAAIHWLINNRYAPPNSGITEAEFGWEIAQTGTPHVPETLNLTSYSLYVKCPATVSPCP